MEQTQRHFWFRLTQFLANAVIAIELTLLDTIATKMFLAGMVFVLYSTLVGALLPYTGFFNT